MKKETIKIMLDFLQGPIWLSDIETGEPFTEVEIVNNDPIIRELNRECGQRYTGYYKFDYNGQACFFDEEAEKKDKYIMIDLLTKLINRLNEINDGSYVVEDFNIIEKYKNL